MLYILHIFRSVHINCMCTVHDTSLSHATKSVSVYLAGELCNKMRLVAFVPSCRLRKGSLELGPHSPIYQFIRPSDHIHPNGRPLGVSIERTMRAERSLLVAQCGLANGGVRVAAAHLILGPPQRSSCNYRSS